jgi:acyl-CoA dehydrogenase
MCRDLIEPNAKKYDETGDFPRKNIEAINELGLNAMFIPEEYGGAHFLIHHIYIVREISKACASTGIIWATNFHGMKPIIDFGTEEQKQRLLPRIAEGGIGSLAITEPHAGSDATGMRLSFTPDGDTTSLSTVTRYYISYGDVADFNICFLENGLRISWLKRVYISTLVFGKGTPGV